MWFSCLTGPETVVLPGVIVVLTSGRRISNVTHSLRVGSNS